MAFTFSTPLTRVPGVGDRFASRLRKLGIAAVGDLLRHFPSRYEDFSRITKISDLTPREECTIEGVVKNITVRRAWRKRMFIIEARIKDETGEIRAVWFNQTYIQNILREGVRANFSGKVSLSREGEWYLSNPNYEVVRSVSQETRHTGRIIPIYPETRGLTSKGFRYLIQRLLEKTEFPADIIPQSILKKEGLPSLDTAFREVHFPQTIEEAFAAKRRFAFEDLFLLQLHFTEERRRIARERAHVIPANPELIKKFVSLLPFELTPSQKRALWEIAKDMGRPFPMSRLLQGDVGSGKTAVAAIAALIAADRGLQTAFMAPTEILARQHYRTLTRIFPEEGGGVALVTASESRIHYGNGLESALKKVEIRREITAGKIHIIVGTHALLQKDITIPSLALVIIDEQHRFGVRQRAALRTEANHGNQVEYKQDRGSKAELISNSDFAQAVLNSNHSRRYTPHFLSMSATPIPRTLSLTVFGDLDLSLITELPKDRKQILTKIVLPAHRQLAYEFIKKEIRNGRQAFVVCPRIQPKPGDEMLTEKEVEKINIKTVVEEYEKLSKKIFPEFAVEMLHGKIKAAEKERIMHEFAENRVNILVATSVIEVGIDVPNATIMMIEGAERFGLAQLYQFRGRVGRGAYQSYCFLFSESSSPNSLKRLSAIQKAKNGLELAEYDLALRGPGEFLGTTQTGMPDLAMKALQHPELAKNARAYARKLVAKDPSLSQYRELKKRLAAFAASIHGE